MKLGKALAIVVVSAVAIYVGLKSYVYYKTRASVQHLVEQVSPFVAIEYRGIGSTLATGTVQVDDVRFRPNGIADTVYVRAVVLRVGSLPALLKLVRQSDDKAVPTSLTFALQGASASLDGALLRTADRFLMAAATAAGTAEGVPHCGNQPQVGFAFLRQLGYDNLTVDTQVRYDADPKAKTLTLGIKLDMQDIARVSMDMQFAGAPTEVSDLKAPPPLREFALVYKDLSYQDRLKRYCMQAAKLSEAQYLEAEMEHASFYRRVGIVPGPGLREAYREFLTHSGSELQLRSRPVDGFDPRGMRFYQPADVLEQLNLAVTVNGKAVDDLSFAFGAPAIARSREAEAPPAASAEERDAAPPKSAGARAKAEASDGFRTVKIADLRDYVSYRVRLHETGRQPREGVLTQIAGGAAHIERRYGSGNIVVKVPLARIEKAEVFEP